ncbi:MAG: DUF2529 family protein [Candidatus Latescibacteria bacterium]|jgi:uncharacterized phosphosugar-binding protein|nr:DUF2529 family protein [Candidatus Latescibacterota bacterium]
MLEEQFFRILFSRMNNIEEIEPQVTIAADMVIAAVTSGGRFVVYDENGQMSGESSYRCSGLRLPVHGATSDMELIYVTAKDVVIIYSLLPATEKSLAALDKARVAGCYIIAVCPKTRGEKIPPGRTLAEYADIHIDDLSDAEGVIRPEGWKKSIAPTTAIMNDIILWYLHGTIIDRMLMRGMVPGVLRGGHIKGGNNWNKTVVDSLYKVRGW